MPRTVSQLVRRTRELLTLIPSPTGDVTGYRDGFDADPGDANFKARQISILDALNEWVVGELSKTRAKVGDVTVTLVSGQGSLDGTVVEVLSPVVMGGRALERTTHEQASRMDAGYLTTAGTPTRYIRQGRLLRPVPYSATGTLSVRCALALSAYPSSSVGTSYTELPEHIQYLLPYGAACIAGVIDINDEDSMNRVKEWREYALDSVAQLVALYGEDFDPGVMLELRTVGTKK